MIERKPPKQWDVHSLSWCTHFSDLRDLPADPELAEQRVLRELKHLALFSNQFIIPFADLLNNLVLQRLFLNNTQGILDLLFGGVLVPNIRDDASDFVEINKVSGRARARPSNFEDVNEFCSFFSNFLRDRQIQCISNGISAGSDPFRELLQAKVTHRYFSPSLVDQIYLAIKTVDSTYGTEKNLRFGHLYHFLKDKFGVTEKSQQIQLLRAAHSLAIPKSNGLMQSSAQGDMIRSHLEIVYGTSVQKIKDPTPYPGLLPKKIAQDDFLDHVDFVDIMKLRRHAFECGYYGKIRDAQSAVNTEQFEAAYGRYLEVFSEYLARINSFVKAELFDWQMYIAKKHLDRDSSKIKFMVASGVPIALASVGALLNTESIVPIAITGISAASFMKAIEKGVDYRNNHKRDKLSRFVQEGSQTFASGE